MKAKINSKIKMFVYKKQTILCETLHMFMVQFVFLDILPVFEIFGI